MDGSLETLCELLRSPEVGATIADSRPAIVLQKRDLRPVFANASGVRQQGARDMKELRELEQCSIRLPQPVIGRIHRFAASASDRQRKAELVQIQFADESQQTVKALERVEFVNLGDINSNRDLMLVILASRAEPLQSDDVYGLQHWVQEGQFVVLFDQEGGAVASCGDHTLLDDILEKVQLFADENQDEREPMRVRRIRTSDGERDIAIVALAGGPEHVLLISRVPQRTRGKISLFPDLRRDRSSLSSAGARVRSSRSSMEVGLSHIREPGGSGVYVEDMGTYRSARSSRSARGGGDTSAHRSAGDEEEPDIHRSGRDKSDTTANRSERLSYSPGIKVGTVVDHPGRENQGSITSTANRRKTIRNEEYDTSRIVVLPSVSRTLHGVSGLGNAEKNLDRRDNDRVLSISDVSDTSCTVNGAKTRSKGSIPNIIGPRVVRSHGIDDPISGGISPWWGRPLEKEQHGCKTEVSGAYFKGKSVLPDDLNVPSLVTDFKDILHVNPAFLDLFGWEKATIIEGQGGVIEFASDDGRTTRTHGVDLTRFILESGGVAESSVHLHSVLWHGEPAALITLQDIDGTQNRYDHGTRSSTSFDVRGLGPSRLEDLEAVFDHLHACIFILDENKEVKAVNKATEALFQATDLKEEKASILDFLTPTSYREVLAYLERVKTAEDTVLVRSGIEVIAQLAHGASLPMRLTATSRTLNGSPRYYVVMQTSTQAPNRDFHNPESASLDMKMSSVSDEALLPKIYRELNEVFADIMSSSKHMLDGCNDDDGYEGSRTPLTKARACDMQVMSWVNDLLTLSKLLIGTSDLKFEIIDLRELITECVGIIQALANTKRVIIRSSFVDSATKVIADLRSLRQIVLRLLSHSVLCTRAGRQVIISTSKEENGELHVKVVGVGPEAANDRDETSSDQVGMHPLEWGGASVRWGSYLELTEALVESNHASFHVEQGNSGTTGLDCISC